MGKVRLPRKFKIKKGNESKDVDLSPQLDKFRKVINGSEVDTQGIHGTKKVGVGVGGNPHEQAKTPIDWDDLKFLAKIQCTQEEMASKVEMTVASLDKRCMTENGMRLGEFQALFAEGGKASLRRKQWNLAGVNATMSIHLGKQYLGQHDKVANVNLTATTQVQDLARLEVNDLEALANVLDKLPQPEGGSNE